jgi:hypothetical protein
MTASISTLSFISINSMKISGNLSIGPREPYNLAARIKQIAAPRDVDSLGAARHGI